MGNSDDLSVAKSFTVVVNNISGLPVSGAALWLDASYNAGVLNGSGTAATNGQTVGTWSNIASGASGAVTQSTDANRPTYATNSLNGKPVLHFNGANNNVLSSTSTYSNTGSTVSAFAVVRRTADTTNSGRVFGFIGPSSNTDWNNNSNWCLNSGANGSTFCVERANGHNQGALPSVNTAYLMEVIIDGTNCTTYLNGTAIGTAFSSTGNFNINQIGVGDGWGNGTPSWPMTGDIAEIILYNSALNTTNRQTIESYLTNKWLNVPTNHTPTLNNISNPAAVNLNAGVQTVAISGISDGDSETQTIQVTVTSSNTTLIPSPTVTSTRPGGTVTYTPATGQYGTATLSVTVRDAGLDGTMGNGDDLSVTKTFTVVVNNIAGPPVTGAALWLDASLNSSVLNGSGTAATNGQTVGHLEQHRLGSHRGRYPDDRRQSANLSNQRHQRQVRAAVRRIERRSVVHEHLRMHNQLRQRVRRGPSHGRLDRQRARAGLRRPEQHDRLEQQQQLVSQQRRERLNAMRRKKCRPQSGRLAGRQCGLFAGNRVRWHELHDLRQRRHGRQPVRRKRQFQHQQDRRRRRLELGKPGLGNDRRHRRSPDLQFGSEHGQSAIDRVLSDGKVGPRRDLDAAVRHNLPVGRFDAESGERRRGQHACRFEWKRPFGHRLQFEQQADLCGSRAQRQRSHPSGRRHARPDDGQQPGHYRRFRQNGLRRHAQERPDQRTDGRPHGQLGVVSRLRHRQSADQDLSALRHRHGRPGTRRTPERDLRVVHRFA